jgi:hypothetical protein
MPCVAVPLGRGVAEHLVAVDVDDDHAVGELAQRRGQPAALLLEQRDVVRRSGERLFELGRRRLVAA